MHTPTLLSRGALVFGLMLLGAGCATDSDFATCFKETPWNSCVNFDGVDEALIGEWVLESEVVNTPAGSVTNPYRGRVVAFGIAERVNSITGELERYGLYGENYGSESAPNAPYPDCDGVLGTSGGAYRSEIDVDLDNYDPASSDPVPIISTLKTYPIGQQVQVTCERDGTPVKSNRASTPFGVGKADVDSAGAHVQYTYTLDNTWSTLVMTHSNSITGVDLTYTFERN